MKYNELRRVYIFEARTPEGARVKIENRHGVIPAVFRACPSEGWYEAWLTYKDVQGKTRVKCGPKRPGPNGGWVRDLLTTGRVYARYKVVDRRTGDVVQRSEG